MEKKKLGKTKLIFNVLFPFSSIKKSISFLIGETKNRNKEIKDISENYRSLFNNISPKDFSPDTRDDNYHSIFGNKNDFEILSIINKFNRKKNLLIIISFCFFLFCVIQVLSEYYQNINILVIIMHIFFGVLPVLILLILAALCQFKIWQILNKRLSKFEKAGWEYFLADKKFFIKSFIIKPTYTIRDYEDYQK